MKENEMKTAAQLYSRLTEVERGHFRLANDDRLMWFIHNTHLGETDGSLEMMKEVQNQCNEEFKVKSSQSGFQQATWLF